MYSALYYPHTKIRNESLLKTALLLWDRIHLIVPWNGYRIEEDSPLEMEAIEIIGKAVVPSQTEKQHLHRLVKDFISRPLPNAFFLPEDEDAGYEMFKHKLLSETWDLLRRSGMAQPTRDRFSHYTAARPTGLVLMSLLADCCAGNTLTRVTDRAAAYASLSGLFVQNPLPDRYTSLLDDASRSEAELVLAPIAIEVIDPDQFSLEALVNLRKSESKRGGIRLRAMRHNFADKLRQHAQVLAEMKTERDIHEVKQEFRSGMEEAYGELREALGLKATQILVSKEFIASVALASGFIAAPATLMSTAASHLGSLTSIAFGAIGVGSKFYEERAKILRENPTAYLYEISKS